MAFDFPSMPAVGQVFVSGDASYTWSGYAWMQGAVSAPPGDYVLKAGDTMTGFLVLNANPTLPLHAATKGYVDTLTTNLPQGTVGQALVVGITRSAGWGNPIEGGNF